MCTLSKDSALLWYILRRNTVLQRGALVVRRGISGPLRRDTGLHSAVKFIIRPLDRCISISEEAYQVHEKKGHREVANYRPSISTALFEAPMTLGIFFLGVLLSPFVWDGFLRLGSCRGGIPFPDISSNFARDVEGFQRDASVHELFDRSHVVAQSGASTRAINSFLSLVSSRKPARIN